MKKVVSLVLVLMMVAGIMAGCGKSNNTANTGSNAADNTAATDNAGTNDAAADETNTDAAAETDAAESDFDTANDISLVSREDGSGTRGAFIELFGIEEKDAEGNKIDNTTDEAMITNSTSVMMTTVASDEYALGYISLGSLDDTIKAVKVDGVEASVENVKNGTYKIARPFNIATKEGLSDVSQDFINYILSAEGQAVIEENGYVSVSDAAEAFASSNASGKIVIAGSSSVTPVMEKLKEAYLAVNAKAEIEIQESDSTTGMSSTIEGICDIGMASRELKDTELSEGLTSTVIAMDGLAVIVNNTNPLEDITSEQVKNIYIGDVYSWDEIMK